MPDFAAGVLLLVDKPLDWTSFDVVNKIRYQMPQRNIKVGHAGTLDPKATGLLLICTGKLTKQIDLLQAEDKEYEGSFCLGATTPSYDTETAIDATFPYEDLSEDILQRTASQFIGEQNQLPPLYSAIKVGGTKLYEIARKGKDIERSPRKVFIHDFNITNSTKLPEVDFCVRCSKGTYIRSLAHDFGIALHSGAYLSRLVRTRSGNFNLANAWQLQELVAILQQFKQQLPTS